MASIFNGAANTLRDLKKIRAFAPDEFARALFQEAQVELKEIKRLTPVLTGALRASEVVTEPKREGRRIWLTIEAGGPSAPYGFAVHEDTEAFHKHGQAKFIEQPVNESRPYFPARVAKRIDLNKAL